MQTILAIEASTQNCSIELRTPHGDFHALIEQTQQHSARLLPAIHDLLEKAKIEKPQLIAVAIGPGAFTSLRVVVGTAQGLALGWDVPVLAINTLCALAAQALQQDGCDALQTGRTVLSVLDARMGEVYVAAYTVEQEGHIDCILEPCLMPYDARAPLLADVVIGNAASMMPHWPAWGKHCIEASPNAASVMRVALLGLKNGVLSPHDASVLQPAYVRDQVAQTQAERDALRIAL